MVPIPTNWLRIRFHLVYRSIIVGFLGFVAATSLFWVISGNPTRASRIIFSFAGLLFGFAVLGWSGTLIMGRSLKRANRHLEFSSVWTQRRSRRAMVRIGSIGVGGLVGASVIAFFEQIV